MRSIFDAMLIADVLLLLVSVILKIPFVKLIILVVFGNALGLLFWIFYVRKAFSVEFSGGKLTGPGPSAGRKTVMIRKIDHGRIEKRTGLAKLLGFRDVHTVDGNRVRLFYALLGRPAIHEILDKIDQYPFRDSA
ncbi:MAG: hypothetical protein A2Z83_03180 [Omnitrophica bacterium GWA2_52_8]|nr:MAG: hypothetical protein A2Z83_03180 [Omnitrophica bacterium GWA2_52_8]